MPLLSSRQKQTYLTLYNFLSSILWFSVLGRVVLLLPLAGYTHVYDGTGNFVKWTQTGALLEVAHAALGEYGIPGRPEVVGQDGLAYSEKFGTVPGWNALKK